jgi:hypothetical protein
MKGITRRLDKFLMIEGLTQENLGYFFWNRGGRNFFENFEEFESAEYIGIHHPNVKQLKRIAKLHSDDSECQDFLDCLACLGEERVKELI